MENEKGSGVKSEPASHLDGDHFTIYKPLPATKRSEDETREAQDIIHCAPFAWLNISRPICSVPAW